MQKNQHHLSTAIFVSSFGTDLFVLTKLNLSQVQLLFSGYLAVSLVASLINHALAKRVSLPDATPLIKTVSFLTEFIAQFFIGGLLSGFLIFYTLSGSLYASWPFIVLLALVFLGNEFLRSYRSHLAFQILLLYIATYAYLNSAVPIWYGTISVHLFLLSSALAAAALLIYLLALWLIDHGRLRSVFGIAIESCIAFTALFMLCYFSHLIPPVPLSLKEAGIYQMVTHDSSGSYTLTGQVPAHWWDMRTQTLYTGANDQLSTYTAIFAPTAFTTGIEHEWELYDPASHVWKTQATIAFSLSGGREGGYRGYTTKTNVQPGSWRVAVKTLQGQVIGYIRFNAVAGAVPTALVSQTVR